VVTPLPTDSAEQFLRKAIHASSHGSMKGPGWTALIAALASAIEQTRSQAPVVFDQLHLASATGKWLDRRAASLGMERPKNVGMDDETFVALVIAVTNGKLTAPAILEVLELFYGLDSTRAHVITTAEPFNLIDGQDLTLKLDGRREVTVVFRQGEFEFIAASSALEVAAAVNRALVQQQVPGLALPWYDAQADQTKLAIYTGCLGLRGSVEVVGGAARVALGLQVGKATLFAEPRAAYVKMGQNLVEVVVPATSAAVQREEGECVYLADDTADETDEGFICDEHAGLPITEVETEVAQAISEGRSYRVLAVADATEFPDEPGHLVIAFGYDNQTAYVPYLGRASNGELLLDPSYRFPFAVDAGAAVHLLAGRTAPATLGVDGDFWLTPSPVGRVACVKLVEDIVAGGMSFRKTVVYPGDEGLGRGEVVAVFAGDDIDAEVAAARETA
jgi:hypothetical protein